MIPWGKASDHFSRKPVLVHSLAGIAVATAVFGLSRRIRQEDTADDRFQMLRGFLCWNHCVSHPFLQSSGVAYSFSSVKQYYSDHDHREQYAEDTDESIQLLCLYGQSRHLSWPSHRYRRDIFFSSLAVTDLLEVHRPGQQQNILPSLEESSSSKTILTRCLRL